MARKAAAKGPRGFARSLAHVSRPTPVVSSASSTYTTTYISEVEQKLEDQLSKELGELTLTGSEATDTDMEKKKPEARKPFRFLDLPGELRAVVYGYHFANAPRVVDLEPGNHLLIKRALCIVRSCRTLYNEAAYFFYSTRTFRLFPTYPGRYFKSKKPLLARLNARQRGWITSLELRVGPGWSAPPKGWVVTPALGLADCVNVRKLTMYVECDPSDGYFNGFRREDGFYEAFCQKLLRDSLAELPHLNSVTFDGYPGVKKSGGMMRGLLELAVTSGKMIRWGPDRGWTDEEDEEAVVDTNVIDDANLGLLNGVPMGVAAVA
ncbi:hypothetical protein QBC35DRAFT_497692 [Podospora australis]|uniref:Uncharacterized protein n=1 Tax=Podospora australis TaxID=1536484 RepID=A0AAN6WWT8_9PEZI|nr:hypothetical protein QBC35DRAFT_497692 [Podospora australis]